MAKSFIIIYSVTAFFGLFFLNRIFRLFGKSKYPLRSLLSFSLPLLLAGALHQLMSYTDTFFIGFFLSASWVGIYNAALPLAYTLAIFLVAFNSLAYTLFSEYYAKGMLSEISKLFSVLLRWLFACALPFFLLLVVYSKDLLKLFFGPEYIGGSTALILLSIGAFFNVIAGPVVIILQTFKKTRYIFKVQLTSALLNISLNIYLIPLMGITGAAIATAASMILWNAIFFIWSYYRLHPSLRVSYYFKYVLSGVGALLISVFLVRRILDPLGKSDLVVILAAFLISYSFFVLILKAFSSDDLQIMLAFERKTGLNLSFFKRIFRFFL